MEAEPPPLLTVEPGYRNVLRVRLAISWLILLGIALVVDRVLFAGLGLGGLLFGLAVVIAVLVVLLVPQRIYRRLRYRLTEQLLQVVRGWLFHSDTVVPLVRVQHIDVTRGPLDKMFGTASLVVHTAGTHNNTVTVPGLAPERANAIRDVIREHVRTDFA